jgi:hypothetical protein
MEADGYKVDDGQLLKVLQSYLNKDTKKEFRRAINRVSNIVVKQTRSNLKSAFKGGKNLQKAVVRKSNAKDLKDIYAKIHIMGKYSKGSEKKGYILKFFETGTVRRDAKWKKSGLVTLKNGKTVKHKYSGNMNRGQTKEYRFFRKAIDSTKNTVESELMSEIWRIIQGLWNN